mmetsp:Transcript_58858/g.172240  ORF Transcript_58858/g.172240 Transcript_58858/m.172240 type:complete len:235 (-) Transcript_58858:593-1297(-)
MTLTTPTSSSRRRPTSHPPIGAPSVPHRSCQRCCPALTPRTRGRRATRSLPLPRSPWPTGAPFALPGRQAASTLLLPRRRRRRLRKRWRRAGRCAAPCGWGSPRAACAALCGFRSPYATWRAAPRCGRRRRRKNWRPLHARPASRQPRLLPLQRSRRRCWSCSLRRPWSPGPAGSPSACPAGRRRPVGRPSPACSWTLTASWTTSRRASAAWAWTATAWWRLCPRRRRQAPWTH